jgi:hypothetical protein
VAQQRTFGKGKFVSTSQCWQVSVRRRWASILSATAVAVALVSGVPAHASTTSPARPDPQPSSGQPVSNKASAAASSTSSSKPTAAPPNSAQALARAHATGKPVVVSALTTETEQVMAEPGGGMVATVYPQPVRTRRHGSWVPIDTTLHRTSDGLAPAATAYGTVMFSPGGTGPLATTSFGHTTYAVSWPTALPAPTVAGSTATYAGVLPGVNLQVSATTTGGFAEVLVVTNRQAALNPALASLHLTAKVTGGNVVSDADGSVSVKAEAGQATLDASPAQMWDSNTAVADTSPLIVGSARTAPSARSTVGADRSDAAHAGLTARLATVAVHATNRALNLVPDAAMLKNTKDVFPMFIDPNFTWHPKDAGTPHFDEVKQGSPCNHVPLLDSTSSAGNLGQLGVGVNVFDSCFGIMRSYYQWTIPSSILGSTVDTATVMARKVSSAVCTPATLPTIDLHWTGPINGGTDWNVQPASHSLLSTWPQSPSAANSDFCPTNPSQLHGFDATSAVRSLVSARNGTFTAELTEDSEEQHHDSSGFSRFSDNPALEITYDFPPNIPTAGQLTAHIGGPALGCATVQPYPFLGATTAQKPPVLDAVVSDPDHDKLQATYRYWVEGKAMATGVSADNLASGNTSVFPLPSSFTSILVDGQIVDWQVQVSDGELLSNWSPICHLTAEPTGPTPPTVSSADGAFRSIETGQVATPGPVDQWTMTEGSGTTLADHAGTTTATLSGRTDWITDATHGTAVAFDSNTGYAAAGHVLDTTVSYSVSAWIKLNSTAGTYTAVSQGANNVSSFYLQYSSTLGGWAFMSPNTDGGATTSPAAHATIAPTLGAWTNLVGVFDASTHLMSLYVNGSLAGTATNPTPFTGPGPLTIGAAQAATGAANSFFNGAISDVQIYNRALAADEASQLAGTVVSYQGTGHAGNQGGFTLSATSGNTTKLVYALDQQPPTSNPPAADVTSTFTGVAALTPAARWRLSDGASPTADSVGGAPATLVGGATWATGTAHGQVLSLDGATGYAATSSSVLDTTKSYSVSAWVFLKNLTTFSTAVSQAGVNNSSFFLQYSKSSNAWAFISPSSDSTAPASFASAHGVTAPTINAWTHLVGVYDAPTKTMSLYVNGVLVGHTTNASAWTHNGPLTIGASKPTGQPVGNSVAGQVSDVQAYARALSPTEVATLYGTSTVTITPKAPGPHTINAYAQDAAGNISNTVKYEFLAEGDTPVSCGVFATCMNNNAISTAPASGDADGTNSFSATDLAAAGWGSGKPVTVDGATFTLPAFGAGQKDNVVAAGQQIMTNYAVPKVGSSSLVFLVTATSVPTTEPADAQCQGTTFTPHCGFSSTSPPVPTSVPVAPSYALSGDDPAALIPAGGSFTATNAQSGVISPQDYTLTVPDWVGGPSSLAAVTLPGENIPSGHSTANQTKIYAFSVPIQTGARGSTITSVTLPDIGLDVGPVTPALHVFGIALRNTTAVDSTASTWTASWASPTEGDFNLTGAAFSNQTFRVAIKPSLSASAGTKTRIKLDNALGTKPLTIQNVTVAQGPNTPGPSPATIGAAAPLMFSGLTSVTIPAGGMIYSDVMTLPFAVTAGHFLQVSYWLPGSATALPEHTWSNTAWEFTTPVGGGNQTTDTTGSPFTATNGPFTNIVGGLDVVTVGTGTQAVLGDGLIDPWGPNATALEQSDIAANLASTAPTLPGAPATISEGIEANELLADNQESFSGGNAGGPSALARIDRDILAQPNVTTVVLDEGLEDVLHGSAETDLSSAYDQLAIVLNDAGITVIGVGLPPCTGYLGSGITGANDPCSAAVDQVRTVVNGLIAPPPGDSESVGPLTIGSSYFPIDADAAVGNGATPAALASAAAMPDKANMTVDGYAALTSAILGPQHTWLLDDGSSHPDSSTTTAADTAPDAPNPLEVVDAGSGEATFTDTPTWPTDPAHGTVLQLNGTTLAAQTASPLVDTTSSFTVSAWVQLTNTTADEDVISQDGDQDSGFALRYDHTKDRWAFTMTNASTSTTVEAESEFAPVTATWTHLVGTYDATTGTLNLYVNGGAQFTANDPDPTSADGVLAIGRGQAAGSPTAFLAGDLSNVQTWNYALTPNQVVALHDQIP